jgi:hypothetical protein
LRLVGCSVTPACAAEKRGHAFYAPVFQSAPRGVKPIAQRTTILFSTASTAFISSTTLLFALSRFVFSFNFYSLPIRLVVRCMYFAFCVFKMGVNVRTGTLCSAKPACLRHLLAPYFIFTSHLSKKEMNCQI